MARCFNVTALIRFDISYLGRVSDVLEYAPFELPAPVYVMHVMHVGHSGMAAQSKYVTVY